MTCIRVEGTRLLIWLARKADGPSPTEIREATRFYLDQWEAGKILSPAEEAYLRDPIWRLAEAGESYYAEHPPATALSAKDHDEVVYGRAG